MLIESKGEHNYELCFPHQAEPSLRSRTKNLSLCRQSRGYATLNPCSRIEGAKGSGPSVSGSTASA